MQTLNIEHNLITNLPVSQQVLSSLDRMSSLQMRFNSFQCSCEVLQFADWLSVVYRLDVHRNEGVNVYVPHAREINCVSKFGWVEFPLLKLANIRKNMKWKRRNVPFCASPVVKMKICVEPNENSTLDPVLYKKIWSKNEPLSSFNYQFNDSDSIPGKTFNDTLKDSDGRCFMVFNVISDTIPVNLTKDYDTTNEISFATLLINGKLLNEEHNITIYNLFAEPGLSFLLSCETEVEAMDSFLNDVTTKASLININSKRAGTS